MKLMFNLKRPADLVIGHNYLSRWYLIPRNHYFNIYLHVYTGSDDDRAMHDHPWWSVSFLVRGELKEHNFKGQRIIPRWWPVLRSARFTHRIELIKGPAVTLFITGPTVRKWGFHCPNGWRHWADFTDKTGAKVGRGCD